MRGPPVAAPSHAWKMKMNYEIFDFGKQKTEKWLTRGLFPYSDRSDQTAAVSVSAPDDAAQEIQRWEDSWENRSVDILNEMEKWRINLLILIFYTVFNKYFQCMSLWISHNSSPRRNERARETVISVRHSYNSVWYFHTIYLRVGAGREEMQSAGPEPSLPWFMSS